MMSYIYIVRFVENCKVIYKINTHDQHPFPELKKIEGSTLFFVHEIPKKHELTIENACIKEMLTTFRPYKHALYFEANGPKDSLLVHIKLSEIIKRLWLSDDAEPFLPVKLRNFGNENLDTINDINESNWKIDFDVGPDMNVASNAALIDRIIKDVYFNTSAPENHIIRFSRATKNTIEIYEYDHWVPWPIKKAFERIMFRLLNICSSKGGKRLVFRSGMYDRYYAFLYAAIGNANY